MSEEAEIWKSVPGWEGLYEVSNLGRLRAPEKTLQFMKFGKPWKKSLKAKILKPYILKKGYYHCTLHRGNELKHWCYHQLVMFAFVGPYPEGMEICHIDGNPSNNRLDNLRYDTRANNHADKAIHETDFKGQRHPMVKLKNEEVLEIVERLKAGETQKQVATAYGVGRGAIGDIWRGRNWSWLTGRPFL